jgi:hypothetical protein
MSALGGKRTLAAILNNLLNGSAGSICRRQLPT